ncbi:MAG: thiosulfate oxidation carrier complex protein SoxZ [Methylomarinum sp.]|nr:thiosulfate oxidation carrier complex protein SoxZ [Methylococcales bacterium]NOR70199.1 thiosulfate oxidation carrier complex protein SoxZ [Methylomarinum sp.]
MSSIKIRTKRLKGNTQIRTLITHPMENGRNKDKHGELIPAHHIQELWVDHNGSKIITCHMAGSISKNPYFDFLLKGGEIDDKITITWIDNLGKTDSATHTLK